MKRKIKLVSGMGRGVFSKDSIPSGKLIETCELIVINVDEVGPELERYIYYYTKKKAAIALGDGSLYNHSDEPNARFYFDDSKKYLKIKSIRAIKGGEEITVDYGYTPDKKDKFNIK